MLPSLASTSQAVDQTTLPSIATDNEDELTMITPTITAQRLVSISQLNNILLIKYVHVGDYSYHARYRAGINKPSSGSNDYYNYITFYCYK